MTILDKAIQKYGFEDPRTIVIAVLEGEGNIKLANDLWRVLEEEDEE